MNNAASRIVNTISKKSHSRLGYIGLELATVISPMPDLVIKIDNMNVELTKSDVLLCESLISRQYSVELLGSNADNYYINLEDAKLKFLDLLSSGDRVLVSAIQNGQIYVIIDKVIKI